MLRHVDPVARSAAAHQALDPTRSMAEQAGAERAQRNSASAATTRYQRADYAWRARQQDAGAAGDETRRCAPRARRQSIDLLLPQSDARPRQAGRAGAARIP